MVEAGSELWIVGSAGCSQPGARPENLPDDPNGLNRPGFGQPGIPADQPVLPRIGRILEIVAERCAHQSGIPQIPHCGDVIELTIERQNDVQAGIDSM